MKGLWLILCAASAQAGAAPCGECFPVERLPPVVRAKAEELLLRILDSEGLYTVAGDLKPMSSGFVRMRAGMAQLDLKAVEEGRRALEAVQCGGALFATVQLFVRLHPNEKTKELERHFEGVVFSHSGVRRVLERYPFFQVHGLTPSSHPMEALMVIEHLEGTPRLRGLGHLYGYPDYAVDFFASAADSQRRDGRFVPREFVSVPTYERPERQFVWAVPVGHVENEEDRAIRAAAARILADYRERRARFIGPDKPGVAALLREWFRNSEGLCEVPGRSMVELRR